MHIVIEFSNTDGKNRNIYGASHLVAELFIGCVDPISSPKMEMYDQKNKS